MKSMTCSTESAFCRQTRCEVVKRAACGLNLPSPRRKPAYLLMAEPVQPVLAPRIWQVGALCRAIADSLEARFNPVAVRGEISGFSRASSGHCYFSLKDAQGQIRCAMFRRAASLLDFMPRDGEMVEVMGRLGVYEPRGDLQLIVESLSRAGQGALVRAVPAAEGAAGSAGPVRSGPQARRYLAAQRHRPRHVAGRGRVARRGDRACAARPSCPRVSCAGGGARRAGAGRTGAGAAGAVSPGRSRHAGRDPAGARRWFHRRPVGVQRRAARAHHRAKPGAVDQRRGPRNRFHDRRLLRRRARPNAHGGGRACCRSRRHTWLAGLEPAQERLQGAARPAPGHRRPAPGPGRVATGPSAGAHGNAAVEARPRGASPALRGAAAGWNRTQTASRASDCSSGRRFRPGCSAAPSCWTARS